MTAPLAPWTARILEILADGDWHTLDELVDTAGPLIPPGHAARRTELARRHASAAVHGTARPRVKQHRDPVDAGRRRIVADAVHELARRRTRRVEFDGPRNNRRIRLVNP